MGMWGSGNFENDAAADYRDDLVKSMIATMTEILDDEDRAALDEEGEGVVMPTVEIIAVLCEQCRADPPDVDTVNDWRDRYVQIFDDQIDGLAPRDDFKAERRAVIVRTFERLLRSARLPEDDDEESEIDGRTDPREA